MAVRESLGDGDNLANGRCANSVRNLIIHFIDLFWSDLIKK